MEHTAIIVVMILINVTMFSLLPVFLYSLVKYPKFRAGVVSMIEDGDGIGHKQDAKDLVMLFFAAVSSWVLLNIFLIDLYSENDFLALEGSAGAAVAMFYGLSQMKKH